MPSADDDPAHDATLAQTPQTPVKTLAGVAPDSTDTIATGRSGNLPQVPSRLSLPDYTVGALLGRGGMGDVVLGRDKMIGRDVAIKQLRTDTPTPDVVARFLREARIQARLEHPSIVPVHQIGTDEQGLPYFTMKKLTGTTLADLLAQPTRPPRQRILRTFAEVCLAIEFAHAKGVVHRDLKPSNIMVGDFGEVYILDWGLARNVGDRDRDPEASLAAEMPSYDGQTEAGAMLGTPGYMAPEQIEDASAAGPAADVYALGAILFELLAGRPLHPRGHGAIASTLKGIEHGPAFAGADGAAPPELDELCSRALATQPAARPSAKELAEGMQRYLDGDRDHERRRELAVTFVERARAALATGELARRAEGMQHAGRALVLDPECIEAADIVQKLVFQPAKEYPPALAAELTASEVKVQQRQGKVALLSFTVVLAYLAIVATNGVRNLPLVLAIAGWTLVHAFVVWRITQRPARVSEMLWVAAGNAILAALLSRTLGSLIIVPSVTCIMALSLTSYPQLIDRKWIVLALLVASWVLPVVLENAGVLAPTWRLDGDRIELSSSTMTIGGTHTIGILIGANVVMIIVFGLFASALARSRRDAMRQAEVQAWHLRQLLPGQR